MALLLIKNIVFLIVRDGIIWYNNHGFKTMIPEYTSCQEGCSGIPFFTVLMTVYRVTQRQATRSLYCHLKLASTPRNHMFYPIIIYNYYRDKNLLLSTDSYLYILFLYFFFLISFFSFSFSQSLFQFLRYSSSCS